MRLDVTRSGGIAGLRQRRSLDTDGLSAEEARELEGLVAEIDLDDLERRSPIRGRGADRFQYELRVRGSAHDRRVIVSEDRMPDRLGAVVRRVLERGDAA